MPTRSCGLAEDAHRAAPSMATYGPLIKALMTGRKEIGGRLSRVCQRDPRDRTGLVGGFCRGAGHGTQRCPGQIGPREQGRAAGHRLAAARAEAFPESRGCWDWVVLGPASPAGRSAGEVPGARRAGGDRAGDRPTFRRSIPTRPSKPMAALAAGEANAREPLDQLVKLGVPLPVGLIQAEAEKK